MACDPETLLADAVSAGFCEVTSIPSEMIELYELRGIAGLSANTPAELVALAKCNIADSGTIFVGLKQYLLCVISGA